MIKENTPLRVIIHKEVNPAWSLALDDTLTSSCCDYNGAILHIMTYYPYAIVLGERQVKKDFDIEALHNDGYMLVRRHTGGSGVLFGKGDIGYHLAINKQCFSVDIKKYINVLCFINNLIVQAFSNLGISSEQASFAPHLKCRSSDCFSLSDKCELKVSSGRKIHGSAFKNIGPVYIQQGAIPVSKSYINFNKYIVNKQVDTNLKGPISIEEHIGYVATDNVINSIVEVLSTVFKVEYSKLTEKEKDMVITTGNKFEVL
jgi:lipoate-protein ligase A